MAGPTITDEDYRRLLALRSGLRRFLRWSEDEARRVGLTPAQHQLLLAVRGHPGPGRPSISDVADALLLRHHSAVELVGRAEAAGLLRRHADPVDARLVRLALTRRGAGALERLSATHLEEIGRLSRQLRPLWAGLDPPAPARRARRSDGGGHGRAEADR